MSKLKEIDNPTIESYIYTTHKSTLNNLVTKFWSRSTDNAITLKQMLNILTPQNINVSATQSAILLELETPIHAMAAWSRIEENRRIYGFYDANVGIVEFSSLSKFKHYMRRFFGKSGLNMAKEYQLTNNIAEEFTFNKVTQFNGNQLPDLKLGKKLSSQISLKNMLLLPILEQPVLSGNIYPCSSFSNHDQFNELNAIMVSAELRDRDSIIKQSVNTLFKEIITSLDNIHHSYGVKKIDNTFILKNKIHDYMLKHPNSRRLTSILLLNSQIDHALFNSDLEIAKSSIIHVSQTRPLLASKLYQIAFKEAQGEHPGLTDFMIRWVKEDPYLQYLQGYTGDIFNKNTYAFEPIFYIELGVDYEAVKYHLLQAQKQDVLTKSFLDDFTKTIILGYSYQELNDLISNEHACIVVFLVKEAAKNKLDKESIQQTGVVKQVEEIMLDKFANINYLRKLQAQRLMQVEKIYQSNHHTDIDAWDKKYSGNAYDYLKKRLNQQQNISDMLSILLEENKGLLISEDHVCDLNGRNFILNNMDTLIEHGVTTIGLEHLRKDLAQPLIDNYLQSGIMSGDLLAIVETKSLKPLFDLAYKKRMKILALDDNSTATIKPVSSHGLMYRAGAANNVAVNILNQLPSDEKFIVIYGRAHLMPHQGIDSFLPGINMRMGLPALYVDSDFKLHVEKNDNSQRKIYDDIANSPQIFFNPQPSTPSHSVPLIKRIRQTLIILDNLNSRKLKINTLTEQQRLVLKDFFHTPEKNLDTRKLLITLTDSNLYLQFTTELRYLMQANEVHRQLGNHTGQDALQRSVKWNTILSKSGALLNQIAQKNTRPGIKVQLTFAPQGLYIGDDSHPAKQNTASLGLAYLYSLSQGTSECEKLLTGLYTHADINGRKIEGIISKIEKKQSEQFNKILNYLGHDSYTDTSLFEYQGSYFLDEWLNQSNSESNEYYQLIADHHIITLAKKEIDNQITYYLYDPNIGEVNFMGNNLNDVIDTIKSTVHEYLNGKNSAWNNKSLVDHYGALKNENKIKFQVFKFDTVAANNNSSLIELKKPLNDGFINEARRMEKSGNAKLGDITLPWQTLYEMGATTTDVY